MSDETNNNVEQKEDPAERQRQLHLMTGMSNAVQGSLIGVHNLSSEDVVLNGIAQYVIQLADASPDKRRKFWNEWVMRLRDVYFTYAAADEKPN